MLEEGVLWVVRRRCAPDFKGKKKLCSGGLEKKVCSGGLEEGVLLRVRRSCALEG